MRQFGCVDLIGIFDAGWIISVCETAAFGWRFLFLHIFFCE